MQALSFIEALPWYAWIAIVAILCGSITKIVALQHRHAERLAMIQAGMRPDDRRDGMAADGKPPVLDEV